MKVWLDDRDMFLDELLRNNGRGDCRHQVACNMCEVEKQEYRCNDCFGGEIYCRACIVSSHAINPLHRTEVRVGILYTLNITNTPTNSIGTVYRLRGSPSGN